MAEIIAVVLVVIVAALVLAWIAPVIMAVGEVVDKK